MIIFFDLEGPLCPIDHAAEVIAHIGKKIGKEEDFYKLFQMLSLYDDELFLVDQKEDYWPGDTLKLIAPIVIAFANEELLLEISRKAKLTPGAEELFDFLHDSTIPSYIISTSYTQHAYTIAEKLSHPIKNVRCTKLDFSLKPSKDEILTELLDDIFPQYLKEGMVEVKKNLDRFFFTTIPKSEFRLIFDSTIVCGGGRKLENVVRILESHGKDPSEAIAIGDSITDIQMLDYVREKGGTAISFNGNEYSLRPSTIAYSGNTIYPLKRLFKAFPKTKEFILNLPEREEGREEFFDITENITREKFQSILTLQMKYRKILRENAAQLT